MSSDEKFTTAEKTTKIDQLLNEKQPTEDEILSALKKHDDWTDKLILSGAYLDGCDVGKLGSKLNEMADKGLIQKKDDEYRIFMED